MLKVGLTGGIGSGKSTVASIFEVLSIPVYYADKSAQKLMNEDETIISSIIAAFGKESYKEGYLNKDYISEIIFNNKEKRQLMNSIVHPATIAAAHKWMSKQSSPYVIKEAALIFESHSEKELDYVIGVKASEENRISRVMERDYISKQEVQSRINGQMNEEEKMNKCDFIITNDENVLLIPQVMALHNKLISLAIKNNLL
jgi:dephospho-CoA kinase